MFVVILLYMISKTGNMMAEWQQVPASPAYTSSPRRQGYDIDHINANFSCVTKLTNNIVLYRIYINI